MVISIVICHNLKILKGGAWLVCCAILPSCRAAVVAVTLNFISIFSLIAQLFLVLCRGRDLTQYIEYLACRCNLI